MKYMWKITYFNKKEREKQVRWMIFSQKLILNHSPLVDEREETMILVTVHKRELISNCQI